jgi:septal ring factor EnvC (AmiA/AmiB activator)
MSNSQALIKIKQSLTTELTSTVNEEEKTTPIRKLFANGRVIRYQELTLPDNLQFPESDDGFGYVAQTNCLSSFKHRVYYDYSKSLIESTEKRVNQQHQAIMDKVASGVKEMTTEINELEQELQRVNTDNSVKEKEISNLEQMMKQSEGKLLAYTQEFKQLQQATTNQSRQSQQELNSLGQAANLSQQDLILRLTLTESHIGDLATQILVLEKTNKHLEEISESQQKNIARLESKRQQDLANKNKQQQIVEQKLQRSLDKIGDLEQDKTQMFEE